MSSSRPRRSSDSATHPGSVPDSDSSSAAQPTITPDTSPESKYQATHGEQNVLHRTVVVIPAAATRYLQSHPFWLERSAQSHCSLSTDLLSVEGKQHPVMRVCARSKDYQHTLNFAKALTKASQFRTVVVFNDEEAEALDREAGGGDVVGQNELKAFPHDVVEAGGGDVVGQNKLKAFPHDVVETEEGTVYLEFHEKGDGRTGKGVSDGTGNEGTGSGSWSGSRGGQGDNTDRDIDRGGEGGERKGGSGSAGGGGSGSAGGGGSGSAGGGSESAGEGGSGSAGGGGGGSAGGGGSGSAGEGGNGRAGEGGSGRAGESGDGDGGGGGGGGDGSRGAIASHRTITSFTRWNLDDSEQSFSVMTAIQFPQTPPPNSYQHRFDGLINLDIDCGHDWKIRQGHILVVAGSNSSHLRMKSSIPSKATRATGRTAGQAGTFNLSALPSASIQLNHSTNSQIMDLVHDFSTAVVPNPHGGNGKSVAVTPNHPKGRIIGDMELKMSILPSWHLEPDPVIVPLPISLRVETFFRGVPSQESKKFVSQNIIFAHQISIPDIYSFQSNSKTLDGVLKDSGPQNIKDDVNVSSSSSTSPVDCRSAFLTLSKKFKKLTGQHLKPPVLDLSPSTSDPLAPPPPDSQSTTPTTGSWSLFPEVTTYRIATKMSPESHFLTPIKNLFRKTHSDEDDDIIVVEYKEGEAKKTEFHVSSLDLPRGVFGH